MPRINLSVPFTEKDEAKQLGARWDKKQKCWYVPDNLNIKAFTRWLPNEPDISIRSTRYFIAQNSKLCWQCNESTNVYGFILPPGHEVREINEEDIDKNTWYRYNSPVTVYYITDLLSTVIAQINALSWRYRIDFSKTTKKAYWMNHCEYCGAKQGDFQMYCDPQGAFFPIDKQAASLITLHEFTEPFGCNGNTAYGNNLFEYMQKA